MRRRRRWTRVLSGSLVLLVAFAAAGALGIKLRYGGGERFPDRTTAPALPESLLEVVADLPLPPGNVAVSAEGRVFVTLHPEAGPETKLVEIAGGKAVPWPDAAWQSERAGAPWLDQVLSIRIDRLGRLWALDLARHGLGDPALYAFDVATGRLVHEHRFAKEIAPVGSHLNDFQVDPAGAKVFIAEASLFRKSPALVVYDVAAGRARRVLERHVSVMPEPFVPYVGEQRMEIFGLFSIRPGVDSIALDRRGEWLYFGAVTSGTLWRVRAADLADEGLAPEALAARVEPFATKSMSDGITTDLDGNVYLSDPEHFAVNVVRPDRSLYTLVRSPRLRWPDGFGFGPDGWLYVTCSSLHTVIMRGKATVAANAPYQVFRFKPGAAGVPGH